MSDSLLAIADLMACQVVLVGRQDGLYRGRLGQCGSGPGEFRRIDAIFFIGDSLGVLDRANGHVAVLTLQGAESRRSRLDVTSMDGVLVGPVSLLDDTTALVGLELLSGSPTRPLLHVADVRTGRTVSTLLREPPISETNTANIARGIAACGVTAQGERRTAVLNRWTFEGVHFEGPNLDVNAHFTSRVSWISPQPHEPTGWSPAGRASVACSSDGALFKYVELRREPDRTVAETRSHLEVRSWDGALLFVADVDEDSAERYLGTPMAADGVDFYFVSNDGYDVPVVREYRLVRQPAPAATPSVRE